MGKPSRDKGKRGENEVVEVFRAAGVMGAKRTAALQAGTRHFGVEADADVWVGDGFHVEVKRQEVLRLPTWLRQLDRDCPEGREGILAFRRSREPWLAVVHLALLAELVEVTGEEPTLCPSPSSYVTRMGRAVVDLVELAGLLVEAGRLG